MPMIRVLISSSWAHHGRKGLERTFMGSVADHVIKHAAVPVLTVNPLRPKVKYVHT